MNMTIRGATTLVSLALLCVTLARADDNGLRLSVSPGVPTVPKIKDLEAKLQQAFTPPNATRTYKLENRRWVEVSPSVTGEHLTAVVRSYDESKRTAYVQLTQRQYNMPILQVWRFNGRTWSNQIDPGIFVGSPPTPDVQRAPVPR